MRWFGIAADFSEMVCEMVCKNCHVHFFCSERNWRENPKKELSLISVGGGFQFAKRSLLNIFFKVEIERNQSGQRVALQGAGRTDDPGSVSQIQAPKQKHSNSEVLDKETLLLKRS